MSAAGFEKQDDRMRVKEAASRICEWYAASRRILPWRMDPTPYHTWIAEIMLQQTRIEAVIPYYTRFLEELPDVPSLAAVPEDRLLKLWEGLGYYSRARNLKKTAVQLTEKYGGELPASAEELRKLPGIGDYTAGAIASIAFGLPEPAVDGNVLRVAARLLASPDDIAKAPVRRKTAELLRGAYPTGREAGLLTEGIMELGETVCLPNAVPRCEICPLRSICLAHLAGEELSYPVKSAPGKRRIEQKTVFLLLCEGRFALRKRPERGLLAGLWEFPNADGQLTEQEAIRQISDWGLQAEEIAFCGEARHIFTHVEWHMTGYLVHCTERADSFQWCSPEEIDSLYSLPTAFRFYREKTRGVD